MFISRYCGILEMHWKKKTNKKLEKLQFSPATIPDEEVGCELRMNIESGVRHIVGKPTESQIRV